MWISVSLPIRIRRYTGICVRRKVPCALCHGADSRLTRESEEFGEEGRGPACGLARRRDGCFAASRPHNAEGEASDQGHVASPMAAAQARQILLEHDVEHPVQALDPSVTAHSVGGLLGGRAGRRDEVAGLPTECGLALGAGNASHEGRLPAIGASAASCVQSHGDDEVILVLLDEARDTATGDGEGDIHAIHNGRAGLPIGGPGQSTAIHAKRARTNQFGAIPGPPPSPSLPAIRQAIIECLCEDLLPPVQYPCCQHRFRLASNSKMPR